MSDFFKNNPIALRHCLLYKFFYGESVEEAFDEFSKIVGPDVIRKEEFQYWCSQFEKGKFDDKEQSVINIKDVLRKDKHALRTCILYESIKLKNRKNKNYEFTHHLAFSVYMHFCKVIGEDVMDYQEFDFWFHRFSNGVFDLKFERDKEQKIYELSDMPLDVMENIVEYLDVVDRLQLEKTSQSLRLFSQDQKVFHPFLALHLYNNSARIGFGREDQIDYEKCGNDCVMTYRDNSEVLHGVSYLKKSLRDFKKILDNPKLYVKTLIINSWGRDSGLFERCIEDTLKFTHLLRVQHLFLRARSMKALLKILPSLKPGYLTTITLNFDLDEATIGKIVELDQWRQAKYFNMGYHMFFGPLRFLYHFHEFTVCYWMLQEDDVREIKEILLKSSNFEKCILYIEGFVDRFSIIQEFGGAIEGSGSICHYPIPNSTEYFEIFVGLEAIKIERKKK